MKQMLLILILLAGLLAVFSPPAAVAAETTGVENGPEGELEKLNLERVEKEAARFTDTIKNWAPGLSFRQLVVDILHGEVKLTPAAVLGMLGRCFWGEVWGGGVLLGKILILAIILAILQQLSTAFERASTSQTAYYACFLVLSGTVVTALGLALNTGREAVDGMVSFVHALLPVLLTLLAAAGGLTAAAILHPAILTTLAVVGTLIKNIVLPLITFSVILTLIDRLSEGFEVSRLSALFRNFGLALLGVLSTVFLGVLTVQGVAGAASAGVALRTAKYATGAFVPVVGGMLADAFEAVVGTSLLLKSAVGIAGVILIFFAVAFPAVKICVLSFLFKLAGAMVQPLEVRVAASLDGVGNGLLGIFAVVATVGLLCFFAVAMVVGLGYLTTMLR